MKTTAAQFSVFCRECCALQTMLNLLSWTIYYQHKKIGDCLAQVEVNEENCIATVTLNTDTKTTKPDILECARHEMWHLFLWPMQSKYSGRLTKRERVALDTDIHRMICVLEKLTISHRR